MKVKVHPVRSPVAKSPFWMTFGCDNDGKANIATDIVIAMHESFAFIFKHPSLSSRVSPLTPAKQTQSGEAGGEEWEGGWERDGRNRSSHTCRREVTDRRLVIAKIISAKTQVKNTKAAVEYDS